MSRFFSLSSIILALCLQLTLQQTTPVYKMMAIDTEFGSYGSKGTFLKKVGSVDLVATHYSQEIFRKLAMIHFDEVNLNSLVNIVLQKPFGVIVIMPSHKAQQETETWELFQQVFKGKFTKLAVYFIKEDEEILSIYQRKTDTEMKFSIKTQDSKPVPYIQLEDFYGYLQEVKTQNQLPTILLVASYDSFMASSEFQMGFKGYLFLFSYKSGAYLLMNIMKNLQENLQFQQNLSYNLMFYLTSSRHNDLLQFNTWLNSIENKKFTSAIQQVIFLDSLADNQDLIIKQSVYHPLQQDIKNKLLKISEFYNIKIQYQNTDDQSQFFIQELNMVQFTNNSEKHINSFKQILGEEQENLISNLSKNDFIKYSQFLTELFLQVSFDQNYVIGIFKDFKQINDNIFQSDNDLFQQNLFSFFKDHSFYPTNLQKGSYINKQIQNVFLQNQFFKQHSLSNGKINQTSNYLFWQSGEAVLTISENQSAFYDIYVFVSVVSYLLLLKNMFEYLII